MGCEYKKIIAAVLCMGMMSVSGFQIYAEDGSGQDTSAETASPAPSSSTDPDAETPAATSPASTAASETASASAEATSKTEQTDSPEASPSADTTVSEDEDKEKGVAEAEQERYQAWLNNEVDADKTGAVAKKHSFSFYSAGTASIPYWTGSAGNRYFYDSNGTLFGGGNSLKIADLSQWNGDIDWTAIKNNKEIDGVILRCGWSTSGVDSKFAYNVSECNRLGIPYGVYLFSYAETASEASEEADHINSLLDSAGASPSYPVYYDLESWSWTSKTTNVTHSNPTSSGTYDSIVSSFMNRMKTYGYDAQIYCSSSWAKDGGVLHTSVSLPYISWIAAWGNESDTAIGTNYVSNRYTNTSSNTGFTGWQYTSKGSIAGITGYVDTDCFYGWSGTNSSNTSGQSVGRADTEPYIEYQAKCQNTGWIASVTEPNTAGTTGRRLDLYQLKLTLQQNNGSSYISGKTYSGGTWTTYSNATDGSTVGTAGMALQIINFDLHDLPGYTLQYRVHSASIGWQDWVNEGTDAGVSGYSIQAVDFRLVSDSTVSYEDEGLYYSGYTQNGTWQDSVGSYGIAGTVGQSLPLCALKIGFDNINSYTLNGSAYIKGTGWTDYSSITNDTAIGSEDTAKNLQAVKFTLSGVTDRIIQYRVHLSYVGWTAWYSSGETAGSDSSTIEGIEFRIVSVNHYTSVSLSKGSLSMYIDDTQTLSYTAALTDSLRTPADTLTWSSSDSSVVSVDTSGKVTALKTGTAVITLTSSNGKSASCTVNVSKQTPKVTYRVHQEDYGWENAVNDGTQAGITGQNKRVEAINIKITGASNVKINAQIHIQDVGWKSYSDVSYGTELGTTGLSKRAEAVVFNTSGLTGYSLQYRVYVQSFGWMNWTDEGQMAGTTGAGYRIEGIEFRIVKSTAAAAPSISYRTHVQNIGWMSYVNDGELAGTSGKDLRVEALNIHLNNVSKDAYISGDVHIENVGWVHYSSINAAQTLGTTGKGLRIECLNLTLHNCDGYKLQYSVYVQGSGWTDWTDQSNNAGTVGKSKRIEGIKLKIVKN